MKYECDIEVLVPRCLYRASKVILSPSRIFLNNTITNSSTMKLYLDMLYLVRASCRDEHSFSKALIERPRFNLCKIKFKILPSQQLPKQCQQKQMGIEHKITKFLFELHFVNCVEIQTSIKNWMNNLKQICKLQNQRAFSGKRSGSISMIAFQ